MNINIYLAVSIYFVLISDSVEAWSLWGSDDTPATTTVYPYRLRDSLTLHSTTTSRPTQRCRVVCDPLDKDDLTIDKNPYNRPRTDVNKQPASSIYPNSLDKTTRSPYDWREKYRSSTPADIDDVKDKNKSPYTYSGKKPTNSYSDYGYDTDEQKNNMQTSKPFNRYEVTKNSPWSYPKNAKGSNIDEKDATENGESSSSQYKNRLGKDDTKYDYEPLGPNSYYKPKPSIDDDTPSSNSPLHYGSSKNKPGAVDNLQQRGTDLSNSRYNRLWDYSGIHDSSEADTQRNDELQDHNPNEKSRKPYSRYDTQDNDYDTRKINLWPKDDSLSSFGSRKDSSNSYTSRYGKYSDGVRVTPLISHDSTDNKYRTTLKPELVTGLDGIKHWKTRTYYYVNGKNVTEDDAMNIPGDPFHFKYRQNRAEPHYDDRLYSYVLHNSTSYTYYTHSRYKTENFNNGSVHWVHIKYYYLNGKNVSEEDAIRVPGDPFDLKNGANLQKMNYEILKIPRHVRNELVYIYYLNGIEISEVEAKKYLSSFSNRGRLIPYDHGSTLSDFGNYKPISGINDDGYGSDTSSLDLPFNYGSSKNKPDAVDNLHSTLHKPIAYNVINNTQRGTNLSNSRYNRLRDYSGIDDSSEADTQRNEELQDHNPYEKPRKPYSRYDIQDNDYDTQKINHWPEDDSLSSFGSRKDPSNSYTSRYGKYSDGIRVTPLISHDSTDNKYRTELKPELVTGLDGIKHRKTRTYYYVNGKNVTEEDAMTIPGDPFHFKYRLNQAEPHYDDRLYSYVLHNSTRYTYYTHSKYKTENFNNGSVHWVHIKYYYLNGKNLSEEDAIHVPGDPFDLKNGANLEKMNYEILKISRHVRNELVYIYYLNGIEISEAEAKKYLSLFSNEGRLHSDYRTTPFNSENNYHKHPDTYGNYGNEDQQVSSYNYYRTSSKIKKETLQNGSLHIIHTRYYYVNNKNVSEEDAINLPNDPFNLRNGLNFVKMNYDILKNPSYVHNTLVYKYYLNGKEISAAEAEKYLQSSSNSNKNNLPYSNSNSERRAYGTYGTIQHDSSDVYHGNSDTRYKSPYTRYNLNDKLSNSYSPSSINSYDNPSHYGPRKNYGYDDSENNSPKPNYYSDKGNHNPDKSYPYSDQSRQDDILHPNVPKDTHSSRLNYKYSNRYNDKDSDDSSQKSNYYSHKSDHYFDQSNREDTLRHKIPKESQSSQFNDKYSNKYNDKDSDTSSLKPNRYSDKSDHSSDQSIHNGKPASSEQRNPKVSHSSQFNSEYSDTYDLTEKIDTETFKRNKGAYAIELFERENPKSKKNHVSSSDEHSSSSESTSELSTYGNQEFSDSQEFSVIEKTLRFSHGNSITDDDLLLLSEILFKKDKNNVYQHIQIDTLGKNHKLLNVGSSAKEVLTIKKLIKMYDNYHYNTKNTESFSKAEKVEKRKLLNVLLNTKVMYAALKFLSLKGLAPTDYEKRRELLDNLWFTLYTKGQSPSSSSGFEDVFMAEIKGNSADVVGVHNWIYFENQENAGNIKSTRNVVKIPLGNRAAIVKLKTTFHGIQTPEVTMLVGTSPELEMALYTVCFLSRPGSACPISLAGQKMTIYTQKHLILSGNAKSSVISNAYIQLPN